MKNEKYRFILNNVVVLSFYFFKYCIPQLPIYIYSLLSCSPCIHLYICNVNANFNCPNKFLMHKPIKIKWKCNSKILNNFLK